MKNASRVQKIDSSQQLEHEKFDMLFSEDSLTAQQAAQIGGHEFKDDENVVELVPISRDEDIANRDDVFVGMKKAKEFELTENSGSHSS